MTPYRVALFARYAEVLGLAECHVELSQPATVADLVTALRQLPGGAQLPPIPMVAVNHTLARSATEIHPSDELALLPPLAGG